MKSDILKLIGQILLFIVLAGSIVLAVVFGFPALFK